MAAYVIFRIKIKDQEKLKSYQQVAPSIIDKFGGKILVRGGETASLEGPAKNRRIVIIEFTSMEEAKRFYYSPEYTEAIELRKDAADFEVVVVEGVT
jgi:uncharacterized protein (DUF1330 family)